MSFLKGLMGKNNKTNPDVDLTAEKLALVTETWKKVTKPPKATGDEKKDKDEGFADFAKEFAELLKPASAELLKVLQEDSGWQKKVPKQIDSIVSHANKVKATTPPSESAMRNMVLALSDMEGLQDKYIEVYTKIVMDTVKQRLGFEDCTPDLNQAWKIFFVFVKSTMQ